MTTPQQPQDPYEQSGGSGENPEQQPQQPGQYGQQPGWYGVPGEAAGQYPQQPAGYGQPADQFPPPPPPGSPAGPTPPRSALPRIITAVLVVLVVALGAFLFIQNRKSDPTAAAVGECLKVEGTTTVGNPKSERIDCADPAAQFKVTESGSSELTCDDLELSYVQYRGNDQSDVTDTVCLRPNFEVGECYVEPQDDTTLPLLGDCASVTGEVKVKVESLNENSSDKSVCATPDLSYTYTKRNAVVCFSEAS